MDELLNGPGAGKNYLLLADTGMGKTSFLLNYFHRNQKQRPAKRLRIAMVSLSRSDALSRLTTVGAKKETIAFLDAFDEDTRAIESREQRMQEIMAVCSDFKRVVISSRTQFLSSDDTISRRYTFEKIYLSPLSEREIQTYLERCIPWYQWRRRQQASSLVASMSSLAARPVLLALVPELVAAGRGISELFELYEFMVERWLERERGWIEPGTLKAASEKLAVTIWLQLSAGGIDRVPADDVARLFGVEASAVDRWPLTDQSLLTRDSVGRLSFVHQSTLEYLFISALFRGETRCLSVHWSELMRRLFVSGTNVLQTRLGEPALQEVLNQSFAATGLFPLSQRHRDPGHLQISEVLNPAAAPGSNGLYDEPVWDPTRYVTEHHIEDSLYLCDRSSDTVFFVPTDWRRVESGAVHPESARLFLVTRAEADSQIRTLNANQSDSRSNWRLPTLEELDLVFLLNRRTAFLPSELFVWTADHTKEGERLVGRMGLSNDDLDPRVNLIGVRNVLASNVVTTGYSVSSMPPLGVRGRMGNFDTSFQALLIRVSQGGAQSFFDGARSNARSQERAE